MGAGGREVQLGKHGSTVWSDRVGRGCSAGGVVCYSRRTGRSGSGICLVLSRNVVPLIRLVSSIARVAVLGHLLLLTVGGAVGIPVGGHCSAISRLTVSAVATIVDRALGGATGTVACGPSATSGTVLLSIVVGRRFEGDHFVDLPIEPFAAATANEHRPNDDEYNEPDDAYDGEDTTREGFVLEEGSGDLRRARGGWRRLNHGRQGNDLALGACDDDRLGRRASGRGDSG